MSLDTGDRLGRYAILAPIGAGGMGEVYRARDTELERDVAIKVLPEAVSQNPDRLERFRREAKAVARLSHPNILEIWDFGTEGDTTYAVTELLTGETLSARLESGSLGWRKAAEIGAAIADGINAAHRAGIVHRDLKPSNVFLTADGRVKVLDFGLARTIEAEESDGSRSPTVSNYTDPGSVLGTVGYMSPEQVRGEPAGQLSDIFSLGCVLYEMVCGRRAFLRDTAVETMNAILKEEPQDLRSLSGSLSPILAGSIGRCLEKRPEARFQSSQDLAFALRSAVQDDSGPVIRPTPEEKSIVVLPFDNLSPDPDQDYFADGLTEEIISDLAKVRAMRVISRTSAMQLKGTDKDLKTIGRELNVRYVLEGSVRRAGNNLRITAQLIEAQTDSHVWSDKYTGTLDDVFEIQEKVSRSIVDALELKLSSEESNTLAERPIDNPQAYDCYLRARAEYFRVAKDGLERARRTLEAGLELYGEDSYLYTGMAHVHLQYREYGYRMDDENLQKAADYTDKVVRMRPNAAEGHYLLGRIERYRGTYAVAVRHFERAFGVDPNHTDNLLFLGGAYSLQMGRQELGEHILSRVREIDPLAPLTLFCVGMSQMAAGQFDGAYSTFQQIVRLEPENWTAYVFITYILASQRRHDEVFDLIENISQCAPQDHITHWCVFFGHALRGNSIQAAAALTNEIREFVWKDPEIQRFGTAGFALLDERKQALDWLEHAIDCGWINYPLFAEIDPLLENIRGEERFKDLMDRIKPRWEDFEAGIDVSRLQPLGDGG